MGERDALDKLILELHRAGREVPLYRFRAWALERLQPVVGFDSACWANVVATARAPHNVHLHNCDRRIVRQYSRYARRDRFRKVLLAHPGTAVSLGDPSTRERYLRTRIYREFARKHGLEQALGIVQLEPVSSLYEVLILWRHDPRRPFTAAERRHQELLMPHLVEAQRSVRLARLPRLNSRHEREWALVDGYGFVHEASAAFIRRLRKQWPDWRGGALPAALRRAVRAGRALDSGDVRFEFTACRPLHFVTVRVVVALARLSAREREVASRYAGGETYSSIAASLSLSPATVRNHIARCYRKLDVRNKVELAQRLAGER